MARDVKFAPIGDKLQTIVQYDTILREILKMFTFFTGFNALELAFSLLGHENDKVKMWRQSSAA